MNKNDLILAGAGIDNAGLARTSTDAAQQGVDTELYNAYQSVTAPVVQSKLNTLTQSKNEKLNRLAGESLKVPGSYTNDTILGMTDSDSFNTTNLGNTRTAIPGANVYYDGIEGAHYKNGILDPHIDIQGKTKAQRDAGAFGKSDKVMNVQRAEVAKILGKNPQDVTEQDFIDVSNQQLIQKAANLAGSPDWKAPLIRGVEPTNLSGTYINDKGEVEQIPLNIPVKSIGMGKDHSGRRELAAFGTREGQDVTVVDSANPDMNINASLIDLNAKIEDDKLRAVLNGETYDDSTLGRIENTVRSGASMFTQGWAGLADLGAEGVQAIGNATGLEALHSDGEGIWKDGEVSKDLDNVFGVNEKYMQDAQKEAMANLKAYQKTGELKYLGKSAWALLSTPEMYGTSIGFVFGGGALGAASKANKIRTLAKGIMKSETTLSKVEATRKAKAIVTEAEKTMSKTKKIVENIAHRQPAMVGYSYNDLGNQREEYKKLYGEEMPALQQTAAFGLDLVANNFDYWADTAAAKGKGVVQNFVKSAFKNASKEVQNEFVNKAVKAGKTGAIILADMGVEAGTEFAQNVAQGYGTDMGHKTLAESMEARQDENIVAALGGATGYVQMKGLHNGAEAALSGLGKGIDVLDEKIKYYNNNLEDPEKTSKPLTLDGKYNMWDSVGQPNFKVEDTQAKDTYAQTIAEFAADLHFNQEARKKYGYMGQKEKGEKNIGDVLNDATEKIADVYELKDPKSKDIAKYLLTQKLANVVRAKNAATGKYKMTPEQQNELLKETAEFVKGTKLGEIAFLNMQKQEIKAAFNDKVDTKLADKYLTDYGLDHVKNGEIIADLMTLDDEEYKNLHETVKSMKLMGSAESVIMQDLDSVSKDLDRLREVSKQLGSHENNVEGEPTKFTPIKKSYLEVADQVENTGFLTRSGYKKSLKEHETDINNIVGVKDMLEEEQQGAVEQLETFVAHRGIDKVRPIRIVNNDGSKVVNAVPGIKHILEYKIKENDKILDIVSNKIDTLDTSTQQPLIEKFSTMRDTMIKNQNQHLEVLDMLNSPDKEVRKEAYYKLNETSTNLDKAVLDKLMDITNWDVTGNSAIDTGVIDTTEANMGVEPVMEPGTEPTSTEAVQTAPSDVKSFVDDMFAGKFAGRNMTAEEKLFQRDNAAEITQEIQNRNNDNTVKAPEISLDNTDNTSVTQQQITEFANKIVTNEINEDSMTPEQEEFQRDNSKAIEEELQSIVSAPKHKSPNNDMQPTNEHTEIVKEDTSLEIVKTDSQDTKEPAKNDEEVLNTTAEKPDEPEQMVNENSTDDVVKVEQPKTRQEEVKEVEKTVTYMDWLDKQLDNAIKEMKQLSSKRKVLKGLQREYLIDIKDVKAKLRQARSEIVGLELVKDRVETVPESAYKRFMEKYQNSVAKLKNVITALKGVITKYMKKIVKLQDAENETAEELGAIELQLNGLAKKIGALKKAKKTAETEHARQTRNDIEEVLGDLVKPNNKKYNSISSLISRNASVEEILSIMPRIVTESKDPAKMIQRAINKFNQFVEQRTPDNAKNKPLNMFVPQVNNTELENPLKDIKLGADGVAFEELWKPDEHDINKSNNKEFDKEHVDKRDKIRRQVKNAMHVATAITLKDIVDVRINNKEQMKKLIDNGFASIWNSMKDKNAVIVQKTKLAQKIKAGQFVPEAVFRENAGRRMFKELEVLLSDDLTIQQKTDIQNAMGVLVLNNLLPKGRIDGYGTVTGAINDGHPIPNTISRIIITEDEQGDIRAVNNKDREKIIATGRNDKPVVMGFNLSNLTNDYITDIGDIGTVFEFAEGKDEGQIGLHKMLHKKGDTIANSDVPLADDTIEYLNKQGSMAWKFIGLEKELERYKKANPEGYIQDYITEMIGAEEDVFEKTPTMKFDSELAKYRAEALTIERMLKAHEMVGDNKNFYIKWDYTVSGRSMMRNKLVNPQSSGISRFVVAAKDMINKIDTNTLSDEEVKHIELAMAQAVDIDIDKMSHNDALEKLHKNFVKVSRKGGKLKLKWAKSKTEGQNILQALVADKEFNLKKIQELEDELTKSGDLTSDDAKLATGSKTIMHLYQVVDLLRKIDKGDTKISTNLALEADGITNGMAIMLMQMGWSDYTQKMLQRAGVYATEDKYKSHGDYKSEYVVDDNGDQIENPDIYMSPAEAIQKELKDDLTNTIGELIGGGWRNFMKNPVMTFIYGAGINNITKSVAESLVVGNSYIPGALAAGKINDLLAFVGPAAKDIKVAYKKYEKNKDGRWVMKNISDKGLTDSEKGKYAYLKESDIAKLTASIHKKIAEPFKNGFERTFKEVIEFRQSIKTVEEVNYALFKIRFNEKLKEIGGDKMHNLTPKELLTIKQEMIDEGTYYATDSAVPDQLVDYWKTGKSDTDTGMITVSVNAGAFQSSTGQAKKYNKIIKQLEANVGSIGVTTTHADDGAIMITGHIHDVLNVYDALVMGTDLKKNTEQIQNMNKAFHKINTEYSMLGKAVEKLVYMVNAVGTKAIDPQLALQLKENIERINPEFELGVSDENILINELMNTLEKVDGQREALAKQPLLVNQYMAADDVPGVDTTNTEVNTDGRYKVFGEDKEGEIKTVREALKWMIEGALTVHNKSTDSEKSTFKPKKQSGTMTLVETNKYNEKTAYQLAKEGC